MGEPVRGLAVVVDDDEEEAWICDGKVMGVGESSSSGCVGVGGSRYTEE